MGVENSPQVTQAGKRALKRSRVLLAARLQTPMGEVEARLRDLSRKGALVECAEPLDVGTEVVFSRGGTVVPARVAWSSGRRIGLEFDRMIDESEVLVQHAPAQKQAVQPYYRRPFLSDRKMSEQDRQRAREWGLAMGLVIPD